MREKNRSAWGKILGSHIEIDPSYRYYHRHQFQHLKETLTNLFCSFVKCHLLLGVLYHLLQQPSFHTVSLPVVTVDKKVNIRVITNIGVCL